MVDIARVNLYGQPVGTFRWDNNRQLAHFEYAESFIGKGLEPSPILMPVRHGRIYSFSDIGRETFKGLPGMLADSLPDTYGRAMFDRWLALTGRSSGNAVETLCFLGKRCMGALEFEPAMDAPYSPDVRIELDSLVEVASEALSEKEEFGANLEEDKKAAIAEIVRLGTSAGGQRAKAIIAYNPLTGEVRSGQIEAPEGFDYYLIKLDGVTAEAGFRETQNFGRLEYSFYRLVKECGIEMSDCSLIEENGRAHFLTKRFDRQNGEKIHMQTLCGIAHYDYRNPRSYSYEQAFNVMRALRLPYSQAQEMYRRMVFNVVIRNQDDHTKNISFLMDRQGKWTLSPAYDMGFAYNPKGGWTAQHQMSINGKFDDITRQDLLEFAKRNNIKEATEIIDRIAEVSSRWPLLARECEVPQPMIEAIMPNLKLSI
ncbi:MAG: type II toxin-antitoxin system HipA family toxin [Duncaniella sp.]|uniref:type II toxin-antitoxin system HipA family toxin n=1 Tax=Duncaniella sp. TaxID=2518496 RepID=UPI0023CA36BB|nr:type II toxin-antitoxin system HipA family toxin [Duncaniella sp.]MDE5989035.1 type II toxin-antitoxin system HipA family toxin [Duncaniella sp.]